MYHAIAWKMEEFNDFFMSLKGYNTRKFIMKKNERKIPIQTYVGFEPTPFECIPCVHLSTTLPRWFYPGLLI